MRALPHALFALFLTAGVPMAHAAIATAKIPTIETQADFLKGVAVLEANPTDPRSGELVPAMTRWMEKTEDVTVDMCAKELNPLIAEPHEPLKMVLFFHYMMGDAVYQLRHPGAGPLDAQVGGLQAVIHAYQTIGQQMPQAVGSVPYVDGLIRDFQAQGEAGLRAHTCTK